MNCTRCGKGIEERREGPFGTGSEALWSLEEVGGLVTGSDAPKELCESYRKETRLIGAAALFGMDG